ncbi:MAG: HAMP domain-containing histidine kinase, partial [Bacteroidales bacterium]|nr:HAMP domain-containing histidine kinase [Bacteroidales bacterium]
KEQLYDFIKELNKSSEQTYLLLQNLLAWASVNNGMMKYNPEDVNVAGLVNEVISNLQINADEKQIIINSDLPVNLNSNIDKLMISTVLRNLISNAIKFTSKGGAINIIVKQDNQFHKVTIKDTGIGFNEKTAKKIFDESSFYTTSGTNNEAGSGLGLLLTKEFIEKNGGRIWAESVLAEGASFYFTIPVASFN